MGFAVDDVLALGSGYATVEVAHHDQWAWEFPYVRYRGLLARHGQLAAVAAGLCHKQNCIAAPNPSDGLR